MFHLPRAVIFFFLWLLPVIADAGDAITVHADSTTTFMGTVMGPNLLGTKAPVPITAAVTLDGTAAGKWYVISGTSADYTITLPAPATVGAGAIIGFTVRPWAEATRQYSIASASLLDGRSSLVLIHTNALTVVSDGSTWTALSKKLDTDWVDGGVVAISAPTTNPVKGATLRDKVWWRRSGSDLLLRYEYRQSSAGTAGSGRYRFGIPFGSIAVGSYDPGDAANPNCAVKSVVGSGWMGRDQSSGAGGPCVVQVISGNELSLVGMYYGGSGVDRVAVSSSYFDLSSPVNEFFFAASVLANGW